MPAPHPIRSDSTGLALPVIAFYFPGKLSPCDRYCGCPFLGNFFEVTVRRYIMHRDKQKFMPMCVSYFNNHIPAHNHLDFDFGKFRIFFLKVEGGFEFAPSGKTAYRFTNSEAAFQVVDPPRHHRTIYRRPPPPPLSQPFNPDLTPPGL